MYRLARATLPHVHTRRLPWHPIPLQVMSFAWQHVRRFRRSFRVARTGLRIYFGYKRTQRRVRGMAAEEAAAEWERCHEDAA